LLNQLTSNTDDDKEYFVANKTCTKKS